MRGRVLPSETQSIHAPKPPDDEHADKVQNMRIVIRPYFFCCEPY